MARGGKDEKEDKKKKGSTSNEHCSNCETLQEALKTLQETNKALQDTVKALTDRLSSVEDTLTQLTAEKDQENPSQEFPSGIQVRVKDVEELIEERTNRQLRKTLVIKGIPEGDDERSWHDTEVRLAKIFAETLDVSADQAKTLIDRCHRGGNPQYYKKNNRDRPIFAAMHSWKVCEELLWKARKRKNVIIDYKFGPMTTRRRNLALKKRRELLNNGSLTQAHVGYPARLMGKTKNDKKYRLIEDFSKVDVTLKNDN